MRQWAIYANRADVLRKMVERLARGRSKLSFCYEAGPCGYGLRRFLPGLGAHLFGSRTVADPIKAGEQIKTNGRDAVMLARLHRAGELAEVWVTDAAHEAMRDVVRTRRHSREGTLQGAPGLEWILLRHRKIYSGIRTWTQAYRRWLTTVRFDHPGQQVVLQDYIDAVITAEQRVARLTRQITELMPAWSMAPVATAIQAMGGGGRRSCAVWECGGFPSSDCPCGRAWLLAVAFA